jgi:hypothetical protein
VKVATWVSLPFEFPFTNQSRSPGLTLFINDFALNTSVESIPQILYLDDDAKCSPSPIRRSQCCDDIFVGIFGGVVEIQIF